MDLKLINALGLPHYYTWQQVDRRLFELLAYVDELERIAAEGTAGGDIPFSARSIKPKFLRSVSETLDPQHIEDYDSTVDRVDEDALLEKV